MSGEAGTPRPRGRAPAVAARQSAGADYVPAIPAGGWVQPADLIQWFLPPYVKNYERSLQIPGAFVYLPQASCGAPRACGPVNAFTAVRILSGDRFA